MGAAGGARAAIPRAKAGPIAVWAQPARLFGSRAEPFAPRPFRTPQTAQPQRSSAAPLQLDACAGWRTLRERGREGYTRLILHQPHRLAKRLQRPQGSVGSRGA